MNARDARMFALLALVFGSSGLASQVTFAADSATFAYAPKLNFRFDGGFMTNVGTAGGTGGFGWGLDILGLYYPGPGFALGAGYRSTFDLIKGTTPVSGFFALGRWYFMGQGTRIRQDVNRMEMERHGSYAFYTGLEFAQSGYYLGENAKKVTDKLTGSFFSMNAILGADFRLSDHFEINIEGSMGLLTLASTDEKFRIKGMLLNVGIGYLF